MHAQYEKQVRASNFVNQIRQLLVDYGDSDEILKKQNDSVIGNTTKLQESVQKMITKTEGVVTVLPDPHSFWIFAIYRCRE